MTTPIAAGPLDRRVRAQAAHVEVRYITYNNFTASAFAPNMEDARRMLAGLLELKHVSGAQIIECSNAPANAPASAGD